jgi:hypothetical protein
MIDENLCRPSANRQNKTTRRKLMLRSATPGGDELVQPLRAEAAADATG